MQNIEEPSALHLQKNGASHDAVLPLALRLILLTVFLPEGLSFFIYGLRLTATRLIFIILTPIVFMRLSQKVATARYRFVVSDLFVPLTAAWMFVGPMATENFADSLVHSGPVVLEYLIAYMSTRLLLSEDGQALLFANFLCLIISFVVLDAVLDTISGRYISRELIGQLTGYLKINDNPDNYRFGLLRAAGPLEHPILFGFTSAIGLLFAISVNIKRKFFCIVMCASGCLICFSSAPQQCVIMGIGLLIYSHALTLLAHKWLLLWLLLALFVGTVSLSTNSPFGHVFELITIDPNTAYYRLYIWNMVGPAILQSPFFSVLPSSYEYEGSVDSVWLVLSLDYGMLCSIFAGLSMWGSCSLPTDQGRARLSDAETRLGTISGIVIFLIIFMGFTVHFWGSVWILVGLLVGLRAHLGELGRLNRDRANDLQRAGGRLELELTGLGGHSMA